MLTSLVLLATACTPYVPGPFNQGVDPLFGAHDTGAPLSDTAGPRAAHVSLTGTWVDPPIAPLDFFVAEDLEGLGRGPSHLYLPRPTLVVLFDEHWSFQARSSEDLASRLADDQLRFEAARLNVVVVRSPADGETNAAWAAGLGVESLDVWHDSEGSLTRHYEPMQRSPRWAWLIEPEGQAVVAYTREHLEDSAFGDDVVDDVLTLWGAR